MYMWYNNSAASSGSNGHATFEFFDDFETFNAGDWTKQNAGSTLSQVDDPASSGRGKVLEYDRNGWNAFRKTTYIFTNGTIHFEFYRPSANNEIQFCWRIGDFSNFYIYAKKDDGGHTLNIQKFVGTESTVLQQRV